MSDLHPTAVVDPGAVLGAGVRVGPFCVIGHDVSIGDNCRLGPHVVVHPHTSIGPGSTIHAGAVLGDLPQDLGFSETAVSHVRIGARCVIREGVTIHRGTKEGTVTEIGDDCFLMANSHFAHNVRLAERVIVANGALLAGYVEVGPRTFISGNVVVHQFVRIGGLAMLGGACGISRDVPPFCMTRPCSYNTVVGLNTVGMKRAGFTPDDRLQVREAFRILYRSGLAVTAAVARIREQCPSARAGEFREFVEHAKRGICRARGDADTQE